MSAPTVLIIEDNPITSKLVRITLASAGYLVREAPSGRLAIQAVVSEVPDLILQDLVLPDIDGVELIERIRSLPGARNIPILAFSAFFSNLDEMRGVDAGFTDYVMKPIEPSRLIAKIRSYIASPDASGVPAAPSAPSDTGGLEL